MRAVMGRRFGLSRKGRMDQSTVLAGEEAPHAESESVVPVEDDPEFGFVLAFGFPVSIAARWETDQGTHVVSSLEFDIVGEGPDLSNAVQHFGEVAYDLADYLDQLRGSREATDYELEVLDVLGGRLIELNRRLRWERYAKHVRDVLRALRLTDYSGQPSGPTWHRSPRHISAPLSRA